MQEAVIKEFVGYLLKGERYPLQHTIYNLRFKVMQEELGITNRAETRECSLRRNLNVPVPEEKQEFCQKYDFIVDLAKEQLSTVSAFNVIYSVVEPNLIREIEAQKARDQFRVWLHQKLNCLDDEYNCGSSERGMLRRMAKGNQELIQTYRATLLKLEKKLYPDEIYSQPVWAYAGRECKTLGESPHGETREGMVFVEGGDFLMGSEDGFAEERPVREVTLSGFWMDRCEVSNAELLDFVARDPFLRKSAFPFRLQDGNYLRFWEDDLVVPFNQGSMPAVYVSWYAARYYCGAIGKRLPSEAEWEYAARSGRTQTSFGFGNDRVFLPDHAWYRSNSANMQHVIADRRPNDYGLYDMHGNVWEWVYDYYGSYDPEDTVNPVGPLSGEYRVMRGGSRQSPEEYLRTAMRRDASPRSTFADVGFRCAASAEFPVATDGQ
jgi:formylglycine-generating enzyme required for sulfatase activity